MSERHKRPDTTDDDRARRAAENPLETAAKPEPAPESGSGGVGWTGPLVVVVVAVIVLFVLVAVFQ